MLPRSRALSSADASNGGAPSDDGGQRTPGSENGLDGEDRDPLTSFEAFVVAALVGRKQEPLRAVGVRLVTASLAARDGAETGCFIWHSGDANV